MADRVSDRCFHGSFTQQEPIPEEGIDAALAVLRSGRLHRYNLGAGERGEVAELEAEFARYQGSAHCLAVTSGGQAMQIALRAAGLGPGDTVLTNAFTLAPVPGAIAAVGAGARLVEIDDDLRLDLDDLEAKARSGAARAVLVSHMRGHLCDMDRLAEICRSRDLALIEDCAHTMGAAWNGRPSGTFGLAGCFSTQTYKHVNSGEGGLLTSDDPGFMARATILSGSYMNYATHGAGPEEASFADARLDMPNTSARLDAVRAAILRPQIRTLDTNVARWNALYAALAEGLGDCDRIVLPRRPAAESMVGSSIQFRIPGLSGDGCATLVESCRRRGVELKWFGRSDPLGFTSAHPSWRYIGRQSLPRTDRVLAQLFDMRLPLTFSVEDGRFIARIIRDEVDPR